MYEYKILESDGPPSENNLNQLGKDRWRLAQFLVLDGKLYLYMIREIQN